MALLRISLLSVIPIIVIILLRTLIKNYLPKRIFNFLWGITLCKLLLSFLFEFSLGKSSFVTGVVVPVYDEVELISVFITTKPFLTTLWVIGMLSCTIFFVASHLRCRQVYKMAFPTDSNFIEECLSGHKIRRQIQVKQSDMIETPLTYGLLKPIILLPKGIELNDTVRLNYIITHELVHIKRFDVLSKWLLLICLCIHWFNPFVWIMYILANRDIELSCDEEVVNCLGLSAKKSYALELIKLEEKRSGAFSSSVCFAKNAIEERIVSIMKIRRKSPVSIIISIAALLVVLPFEMGIKAETNAVEMDYSVDKYYSASEDVSNRKELEEQITENNPALNITAGSVPIIYTDPIEIDFDWWKYEEKNLGEDPDPAIMDGSVPIIYNDPIELDFDWWKDEEKNLGEDPDPVMLTGNEPIIDYRTSVTD